MSRHRKITTLLVGIALCGTLHAQDFHMEGGVIGGGNYVAGDVSNQTNIGPTISALLRYNLNFKSAIKFTTGYISSPINQTMAAGWEATVQYELNFLQYGTDTYRYRDARNYTPYYSMGIGYAAPGDVSSVVIPIAIGIKWKAANRINVGAEISAKWMSNDLYDGVRFPNIKKQDLLHKDWVVGLSIFATFDFIRKHENGMNLRNAEKLRKRINKMPYER